MAMTERPEIGQYYVRLTWGASASAHGMSEEFGPFDCEETAKAVAEEKRQLGRDCLRVRVVECVESQVSAETERVEGEIDSLHGRFLNGEDVSGNPGFNPDWLD